MTDQDLSVPDRVLLALMRGPTNRKQLSRLLAPDAPDDEWDRVLDEAIAALVEKGLLDTNEEALVLLDPPADDRVVIDPAIRDCLPPLSLEEEVVLARVVLLSPAPPTLTVWRHDGRDVLIDGHVTSLVCRRFGRDSQLQAIDLPDVSAVQEWRWDRHYGKRNLTKEAMSYCRGWQYERRKLPHGGDRRSRSQNETSNSKKDPIAAAVAAKFGVGRATVFRDRKYATALDAIAAAAGDDIRRELLARREKQYRLTHADVMQLSKLGKGEMKRVAAKLREGERVQFRTEAAAKSVRLKGTTPTEQARALVESLGQERAALLASELTKLVKVKVGK